jgi:hypothetical protein
MSQEADITSNSTWQLILLCAEQGSTDGVFRGVLPFWCSPFLANIVHNSFYVLFHKLTQCRYYKSWRTTILMPWGALILSAGFALRAYGAYHFDNLDILIANTVLIMSGPPVYALINYNVLSRVLFYVPYLSPLHPGRVLTTFLAADGIIEILVVNGALRMANTRLTKTEQNAGAILVKASLIAQALLFVSFLALASVFQYRARKAKVLNKGLSSVLLVMYISSLIILARCIYRIVEFFEGGTTGVGPVVTNEAYFWVFEASIMLFNTYMLNVFHPGRHLPRSNRIFLAQDGVTELRGPGWEANRKPLASFIDPFDFYGMCTGRDRKTRFWEWTPEQLEAANVEKERTLAEKRAAPRSLVAIFLDPFHWFGPVGKLADFFAKMDGEHAAGTSPHVNKSRPTSENLKEVDSNKV